jgi:formamidase
MVGKARRSMGTLDLVVFPEYALHGLSMDIRDEILCDLGGPEVAAFKVACLEHRVWGCFSIMERNRGGMPYNSGLITDDTGNLALYYRKLHPWVPVEPWEPGNLGIPVIAGPNGSKLALIICHDGMFDSMGEAMVCNSDGTIIAHGAQGRADEIITAEVRPDLVREARTVWGVENNIYQLGHRGFSAVRGGAGDCQYTYTRRP